MSCRTYFPQRNLDDIVGGDEGDGRCPDRFGWRRGGGGGDVVAGAFKQRGVPETVTPTRAACTLFTITTPLALDHKNKPHRSSAQRTGAAALPHSRASLGTLSQLRSKRPHRTPPRLARGHVTRFPSFPGIKKSIGAALIATVPARQPHRTVPMPSPRHT